MLSLLNIDQSALLILHWAKKISGPFSHETYRVITDDDHPLKGDYFLFKCFLENAIYADELPALKKPRPKPVVKKLFNAVDVPEQFREYLSQQYDYWVRYSDLKAFVERPDSISIDSYAHARDALARVAWMLVRKTTSATSQTELFEYLAQLVDDIEQDGFLLNLGETTLKGCAKEILSAGEAVERKS
jgi:hypothetical protein